MARYLDEASANADGVFITHQPDQNRFAVTKGDQLLGTLAYTLNDDASGMSIDFTSTFVDDALRGRGVAGLLAEHALNDEIVKGRKVEATCSFIAGYIERNPHLGGVR